jgi:sulfur carrier protein
MKKDIEVHINGEAFKLGANSSLQDALILFGATPPFAVAVNKEFVAKQGYSELLLSEGDHLEIISPITGG